MKTLKVGGLVLLVVVFLNVVPVQTYNPLAHIYVAGRTSLFTWPKADLYYGAIAPDIAWYAPSNPGILGGMTHRGFIDLRSAAGWYLHQRAFARGWLTHNEIWGVDYYAHIRKGGYVSSKVLPFVVSMQNAGIQVNDLQGAVLAEFAIETAIDLLLKKQQPFLPAALLEAVLCRSGEDLELLFKAGLPGNYWSELALTEPAFRNLTYRYAVALALPSPSDRAALAVLGVELAQQNGVSLSADQAWKILGQAMILCADFMPTLQTAIQEIGPKLNQP